MKDERPVTDQEAGLEPPYCRRPQGDSNHDYHIPLRTRVLLVALGICLGAISFLLMAFVMLTD